MISKLKHPKLNSEPQKRYRLYENVISLTIFGKTHPMSHFMALFLVEGLRFRAHATDAILSYVLQTCHPFDTINRITCHEAFMRVKKYEFKVVGK